MNKLTLLLVLIFISVIIVLDRWYVRPAIEQYHEDVQTYHKRNLLQE